MNQEGLTEAYARLKALKSNLPRWPGVSAEYVREFLDVLGLLEKASGVDLQRFKPKIISTVRIGIAPPSKRLEPWSRSFLMMRIDGVLSLFELQMATPRPAIGFNAPK